jgi:hypothetical protein
MDQIRFPAQADNRYTDQDPSLQLEGEDEDL